MSDRQPEKFHGIESRRSSSSLRQLTVFRRIYYFLGIGLLRFLLWILTSSYRIKVVIGAEHIDPYLDGKSVCAPCYWHQHHIVCSTLVRSWVRKGFKACFLVSGSVDGDVPARVARAWDAEVIRGSANRSGALALRDMQEMMKANYSIVTTADGPRGPQYEFKMGAVLMARIAGVPIIPVACAVDRAWYLKRWDKFMIPKPFARIVLAVGAPYPIPADAALDALEPHRVHIQAAVMSLMADCDSALRQ